MVIKATQRATTLGSFLRRRREELGLTAEQVAKRSQAYEKSHRVSQSFLSEIENSGKMPSPLKLLTLARIYQITIAEIYEVLGAVPQEIGLVIDQSLAERHLYPRPAERRIHRDLQDLLDSGLENPLRKLTEEFQMMLQEQRESMMQVIRDNAAASACVVAGQSILVEVGLAPEERQAFLKGNYPQSPEWVRFSEGEEDDFQVSLFLRDPQLKQPVEATIIVPMVRWWAGLKSVIRRLERQLR